MRSWRKSRAQSGSGSGRQLCGGAAGSHATRSTALWRDAEASGKAARLLARARLGWTPGRCRRAIRPCQTTLQPFIAPCLCRHAWPGRRPSCPARRRLPPALLPPFLAFRRSCSGQERRRSHYKPRPAPPGVGPVSALLCSVRHAGAAARAVPSAQHLFSSR